jgi:peptide/nickel transport system substrate-binding protein
MFDYDGDRDARTRRLRAVTTLLVAAGVLCCLAGAASAALRSGSAKPVLRIGIQAAPNPDPAKDTSAGVSWLVRDIAYGSLMKMNLDGSISPELATSWKYFNAGKGRNKAFEFNLKPGVRFSDGEPLNAKAVVTWLKYFDSVSHSLTGALGPGVQFIAAGPLKVRIIGTLPNPNIPTLLSTGGRNAGWVSAPKAVANPSLFATGSYGTGQYMLKGSASVSGDHYAFVPNPFYFDKSAIKYSEIDVKVIAQASSMLQALESGQLDASVGDASTGDAAKSAGFNVVAAPGYTLFMFLRDLNGKSVKALSDVRVRQAMNYAIDRKTIVKAAYGDYAVPTAQILEPPYSTAKNITGYAYNPAKAKQLLAAAGYSGGFTVKTLAVFFPTPVLFGAAKYLDAVGVHLDIDSPPTINDWAAKSASTDFPILTTGISAITDDWGYVWSTDGANVFHYQDKVLSKLWYSALKAPGTKAANALFTQFATRIYDQGYYVPLAGVDNITYVSKHVGGVKTSAALLGSTFPSEWFPK